MKITDLYSILPYPLKSVSASMYGYYLRWWRYGPGMERLVQENLEREAWSPEKRTSWREERLAYILRLAATKVPYYRNSWDERRRNGDRASIEILGNWPILKKEEIRKYPRSFLVDGIDPRSLYAEHTSGTTGTPLHLWCTREMQQQWYALVEARWRRWYGLRFEDRWGILGGQVVTPISRKRPPFWVWNRGLNQLYFSVMHLQPDFIHHYIEAMKQYELVYLYGYTSALYIVAQQMLQDKVTLKMKVVITNAEPLFDFQRKVISEAFSCPVYETYGQAEMLAAASECRSGKLHLWNETGHIECVRGLESSPEDPNVGNLVATGLMNEVMPFIRYNMLDLIEEPVEGNCECGCSLPILPALHGRSDDVIVLKDGRKIIQIDTIFSPEIRIKEAQIIQETYDEFTIKVIPGEGWGKADSEQLIKGMQDRLGQVKVEVVPVNEIPRTWRGKFRIIISKVTNPDQK